MAALRIIQEALLGAQLLGSMAKAWHGCAPHCSAGSPVRAAAWQHGQGPCVDALPKQAPLRAQLLDSMAKGLVAATLNEK